VVAEKHHKNVYSTGSDTLIHTQMTLYV